MRRRRLGALLAALACALGAGCYTKVTDARGIGSDAASPRREKPTTTIVEDLGNAITGEGR